MTVKRFKQMSKNKISIIIPTYNVEHYVARCLDSVINQTLPDIEIIIIDDGSTDNTVSVIKKYAKQDKRIKFIQLDKNSGVSVARNVGIDLARGEYMAFIDSDDYIDLDFYEKLYDVAISDGADIVAGNIREYRLDGSQRVFNDLLDKIKLSKFHFFYTIWFSIYKSEFIKKNKLYNPVGIIKSQDTVFVAKCACLCNKIDVVYDTYYHYIRIDNSLDSEILSEEVLKTDIDGMHIMLDFVNTQNISEHNYNILLSGYMLFFTHFAFSRNTKHSTRMMLMNASIDIYQKYKYKNFIKQNMPEIYSYLESKDAEGLYEYNNNMNTKDVLVNKKIKLFGCIPFLKIKNYNKGNKIKIYLFGLPLVTIK